MYNESTKAFCFKCDRKQRYRLKVTPIRREVRGITFEYNERTAFCVECGKEIYVPEINDINVQAQENAYREAVRLSSVTQTSKK